MITGSKQRGKPKATLHFETKEDISATLNGVTLLILQINERLRSGDMTDEYRQELLRTMEAVTQILVILR